MFLLFGLLKFFPHVSPAEGLTIKTTDALSFGLVPGGVAIVLIASLECVIGLLLISGRWLRVAIYVLAGEFIGIFAPLVLFPGRLFGGPHHAPPLEGQYVIKDLILVAAGLVVASTLPASCQARIRPGRPDGADRRGPTGRTGRPTSRARTTGMSSSASSESMRYPATTRGGSSAGRTAARTRRPTADRERTREIRPQQSAGNDAARRHGRTQPITSWKPRRGDLRIRESNKG